jgi:hypothetical protein
MEVNIMKMFFNFFILTAIIVSGLFFFNCQQPINGDVNSDENESNKSLALLCKHPSKDTFVLIHGSWNGAWCWFETEKALKEKGFGVIAVDLPGHGNDKTPVGLITLNSYVQAVLKVIDDQPGQVILVGHSAGGVTISQAAEYRPNKIKGLIYLSAFLIQNGETVLSIAMQDVNSLALQHLIVNGSEGYLDIDKNFIREAFYGECEKKYYNFAKMMLTIEPIQPLSTPLYITENYYSVKKYYIRTLLDKAVTIDSQNQMLAKMPVNKVYTLETDHSSFFSLNGKLVNNLIEISKILNNND